MEAPFCKPSPFPKSVKYAERPFVKSPHCLEKTSSLKRISNAKFSSSFLSSHRPCFSQNSCLPALLPFSSNARLLPTLFSFFRPPECALFSYLFFKALLPSRRPRLPGADLLSCRYLCILVVPAFLPPLPPFFLVVTLAFLPPPPPAVLALSPPLLPCRRTCFLAAETLFFLL